MKKTKFFQLTSDTTEYSLEEAAKILEQGGVLGVPTDTVYGLIQLKSREAQENLNKLKGRPLDQPLIVFLPDRESLFQYVEPSSTPLLAERLTKRFWPGPLTVILKDKEGENTSFRVPGSSITQNLVQLVQKPVLSTSANFTAQPATITGEDVFNTFDGKIDMVIDGGECPLKIASTIISIEKASYKILREGDVTKDMIERQKDYLILFVCTGNTCRSPMAKFITQQILMKRYGLSSVAELENAGFQIQSAGVSVEEEQPLNPKAQNALNTLGYTTWSHFSQEVDYEQIQKAKKVMTLTLKHREELCSRWPQFKDKIETLAPTDIQDPYNRSQEDYLNCAVEIETYLKKILENL